ncbi:MAG: type 2 isopentenyl-diphosphate Delta-isomerase [Deltaproteobacteria bacterium HGW-Deltaproteobacteria-17]|nr:MAG: type 2 isopentenyl-diphosphate Delta-isomerase [Deltaproteobacteria bacterium HGW-Deltaproteobacteria-17]
MLDEALSSRKSRHLNHFRSDGTDRGDPGFGGVTLRQSALSCVFPGEVDLSTEFLGARLSAPLFLAPITGGTPEGADFNRAAAQSAIRLRLPMATGSLRMFFEHPGTFETYNVNAHRELPLFFGNLGPAAALGLGPERVREACDRLHMDGLFLYFNHAQELAQPAREHEPFDPDLLPEFITRFGAPVIIKETGMGFSSSDIFTISKWPIAALDTSGAGGTNFYLVEQDESIDSQDETREIPLQMGIPTALVIHMASRHNIRIIGSGGVRTGLDMAKALCLGADLVSFAAPLVRAWHRDPADGIHAWITSRLNQLRSVMSLCGTPTIDALKRHPRTLDTRFTETI